MPLKFCANISWLYKSAGSLTKRYAAAKQGGFSAVECGFPYEVPVEELAKAQKESGLKHVLINTWPGIDGELGTAALPGREDEFREKLEMSIIYCKALDCRLLHIMAGKITPSITEAAMADTFASNLRYAAERLHNEGITGLIEPINTRLSAPGYFLDSLAKGAEFVRAIGSPFIRLQMDLYHVQVAHGHITHQLETYLPITGHMQIAQVPNRHEPDSLGELQYPYIFSLLEKMGYSGYIGLEYNPAGDTDQGLQWMRQLGNP